MDEGGFAERVDREASDSALLEWSVRAGMLLYGVLHLLVAWVAVRLVLLGGSGTATGQGALAQLAGDAVGRISLAAMAVAFATLVCWQVIVAAVGFRDRRRRRRLVERIGAASRAVTYGYFALASTRLVIRGQHTSGGSPRAVTAGVLGEPGGPVLVFVAGVVAACIGIGLIVFGLRRGFLGQLEEEASRGRRRVPIVVLGMLGYVVKGAAFLIIGGLLAAAGLTHDPSKSGGLDQAFRELLGGRLGTIAVVVAGAGFGCFGLYLFAVSRHIDDDSLTS